jgi:urease gamma subunit
MRRELTIAELEIEHTELLPPRETLFFGNNNWASVMASKKLMLAPREMEKMVIWTAAQIAEGRKKKGVKLNYPEAIAYIANFVVEGAREGKTVADLMKSAREILKSTDVMKGVPEMIHTVQVEATFPDGTKLVTVHDPVY